MRKIMHSTKIMTEADGSIMPFNVEYYILESQTTSENINISTYGIEILKTQSNDGIEYTETKRIREICSNEKEIYEIADILSNNIVTPICFEEIIDDIAKAKSVKVCAANMA